MAGKTLSGAIRYIESPSELPFQHPVRNVVALLPGSDPTLRSEFVVIGAHNDHIGTVHSGMSDIQQPMAHDSIYVVDHLFRQGGADDPAPVLNGAQQKEVNDFLVRVRKASGGRSARIDSVFNGADDDGSGSMSALEIAEYLAAQPVKPKRSILFVWHVGEEEGLWGSEWFTDHPTVPRENIIAELNMDMVGRGAASDETGNSIDGKKLHGGPGYLQVVGSRRLSTELGDLVESVNVTGHHGLKFDYSMDANGHPQNIYCRNLTMRSTRATPSRSRSSRRAATRTTISSPTSRSTSTTTGWRRSTILLRTWRSVLPTSTTAQWWTSRSRIPRRIASNDPPGSHRRSEGEAELAAKSALPGQINSLFGQSGPV